MRRPSAARLRRSGEVADSSASLNSSCAAAKVPLRRSCSAISRISARIDAPSVMSLTLRSVAAHLLNENAAGIIRSGRALIRRGSLKCRTSLPCTLIFKAVPSGPDVTMTSTFQASPTGGCAAFASASSSSLCPR